MEMALGDSKSRALVGVVLGLLDDDISPLETHFMANCRDKQREYAGA
jgi:hypothetical protein